MQERLGTVSANRRWTVKGSSLPFEADIKEEGSPFLKHLSSKVPNTPSYKEYLRTSPGTWALSATNWDEMLGTLSRISVLRCVLTGWLMTTFQMKTAGSPNKSRVHISLPCPETGPSPPFRGTTHWVPSLCPRRCVGCAVCARQEGSLQQRPVCQEAEEPETGPHA